MLLCRRLSSRYAILSGNRLLGAGCSPLITPPFRLSRAAVLFRWIVGRRGPPPLMNTAAARLLSRLVLTAHEQSADRHTPEGGPMTIAGAGA